MKPNAIPTPNEAEWRHRAAPSSASFWRGLAILGGSQAIGLGSIIILANLASIRVDPWVLGTTFGLVQLALVGGLLFSAISVGPELIHAPLYLSTGFRIGIPLMAGWLIDATVRPGFFSAAAPFFAVFYCTGLLVSVIIVIRGIDARPC
jgi:hypothetical protein